MKHTHRIRLYPNGLYVFLCVLLLQLIVTYLYTNTREFSNRALIRNLSVGYAIYFAFVTQHYYILLFPLLLEWVLDTTKFNGFHMEKYIATKYQYNDYWREIVKKDEIFSNFSEGNYDQVLGWDTTDNSQQNIKKVTDWGRDVYYRSMEEKSDILVDMRGRAHSAADLKTVGDYNKFKLICERCNIHKGMQILEIGFGEGDLMEYICEHYGIRPVGITISSEQAKKMREKGYVVHEMNYWDISPKEVGKYDLILQCANLEYCRCSGEPPTVYCNFGKKIMSILNEKGKYFTTCLHFNADFTFSWRDYMICYILWSGNDGFYPFSKMELSDQMERAGLRNIWQQDRTLDYFLSTVIFMSFFQCRKEKCTTSISWNGLVNALIKTIAGPYFLHTYLCYSPTHLYEGLPFLWEFIPQERDGKWISPVSLQYILFEKPSFSS